MCRPPLPRAAVPLHAAVRLRPTMLVSSALLLTLLGCDKTPAPSPSTTTQAASAVEAPQTAPLNTVASEGRGRPVQVGDTAPGFALADLAGQVVKLESFAGKVVVLEWFNPECPFVQASHTKGSLVDAAKKARNAGVVWLAINSGAPGKQGHGVELNQASKARFGLEHPILLDETGVVGRAYGAERTPHMYIIDRKGKVVYQGAPDNSPDGEGVSPEGGTLVAHLDQALAQTLAGQPVTTANTKAYGCSVKYTD